jgi:hypothetical protein
VGGAGRLGREYCAYGRGSGKEEDEPMTGPRTNDVPGQKLSCGLSGGPVPSQTFWRLAILAAAAWSRSPHEAGLKPLESRWH